MLPFFFSISQSKLPEMTAELYKREFGKKKGSKRVWCILGYKPYVKNLNTYETAIEQAKVITNGSIAYAKVNCQAEEAICKNFQFSQYPSIIFKNKTTQRDFQEPPNPSRIVKNAFALVNSSLVQEIDDFWIEDYREHPTAILFISAAKRGVPGGYAALSRVYAQKIRFGICHDDSFLDEFNIKEVPTLAFYDGERTVLHEGRLKFRYMNETANAFLHKRQSRSPVGSDFHTNNEMPEVCYDYTKTCIFTNEEFVDPELDEVRNKFRQGQFQFFVGKQDFPFSNIPDGATVVYSAKKEGIIVEKDVGKIASILDRVIDGTAKFKSLRRYIFSAEL